MCHFNFQVSNKIENTKYLENSMQHLTVLQRRMSKKQKSSKKRAKTKFAASKLYNKLINQKIDFQHKLSSKLIGNNQALAFETLNVSGILKYHYLAQYIADVSWSSFVTKLEYKAEWYRKIILRIG